MDKDIENILKTLAINADMIEKIYNWISDHDIELDKIRAENKRLEKWIINLEEEIVSNYQ